MTLEEKIKKLMESQQGGEVLSEESIESLDEAKIKMAKDGEVEVDSDDSAEDKDPDQEDDDSDEDKDPDQEDDDSDEDTDVEKDMGKKNKAEVKEGSDPFGALTGNGGDSAGDAGKNAKLKTGLNKKDAAPGKLTDTASADKSDDNGDNAKMKVGLGKKETGGKLTGPSAGSEQNPANAKNNVKEHMTALFSGEELSEEFQSKAATIFEAAVEQVAQSRVDALQEEYALEIVRLQEEQLQQVEEAVEEVRDELVEQVDGFLNLVVEQWIEENQVALESGMKVELVNGFIDGLKTLFKENYVDIPEDKLDVIEEQSAEIESLSVASHELSEQVVTLEAELASLKSQLVFESVADDLTDIQAEKFKELVENVEFTTVEDYAEKLETLKESYFRQGRPQPQVTSTETISESVDYNPMDAYVSAVAKNLKFR